MTLASRAGERARPDNTRNSMMVIPEKPAA